MKRLDDFLTTAASRGEETGDDAPRRKRKRLKSTSLESFLPEEHVDYFKKLRIGSKRIRHARIDEL